MVGKLFLVVSLFLCHMHLCLGQWPSQVSQALPNDLQELVEELNADERPDKKKLRHLFFTVKRSFLINHQLSSTLASTLRGENYDCVTGTLVFDRMLKVLGYQTTIHEFNHHVLLEVASEQGPLLFDSTDPYGIIRGRKEIAATIAFYKKQKKVLPNTNIYARIESEQALGLYYFNQSVKHLDTKDIGMARAYANLALQQYPCDRTLALQDLLSRPTTYILTTYGQGSD